MVHVKSLMGTVWAVACQIASLFVRRRRPPVNRQAACISSCCGAEKHELPICGERVVSSIMDETKYLQQDNGTLHHSLEFLIIEQVNCLLKKITQSGGSLLCS